MSELELLHRAKNNDELAFKEIFVRNRPQIFYVIFKMVNNQIVAEDLTMETFEKAFAQIHKFVPNYKISTWLVRIGKNRAIDYLRMEAIRPKRVTLDFLISDPQNPENILIGTEEAAILEKIVGNMKEGTTKRCINLRMEGKSCKEICEKLDLPIGTVNPALRRARIHIKKEKIKFESRAKKVDDINIQNRKYKRWKHQKSINS